MKKSKNQDTDKTLDTSKVISFEEGKNVVNKKQQTKKKEFTFSEKKDLLKKNCRENLKLWEDIEVERNEIEELVMDNGEILTNITLRKFGMPLEILCRIPKELTDIQEQCKFLEQKQKDFEAYKKFIEIKSRNKTYVTLEEKDDFENELNEGLESHGIPMYKIAELLLCSIIDIEDVFAIESIVSVNDRIDTVIIDDSEVQIRYIAHFNEQDYPDTICKQIWVTQLGIDTITDSFDILYDDLKNSM